MERNTAGKREAEGRSREKGKWQREWRTHELIKVVACSEKTVLTNEVY